MIVALVFSTVLTMVAASLVNYATLHTRTTAISVASAQARALAEGALDKAVHELNQNSSYAGEAGLDLGEGEVTITVTSIDSSTKRIEATASVPSSVDPVARKTIRATASIDTTTVAFQFGVQVGDGGIDLQNTSSVRGNVYSTGPVTGEGNIIRGDVISAGPSGLIDDVHATGTAYAHTIRDSDIDKDAYYVTISNTSVGGVSYPGSPDQATSSLPISDATIQEWKDAAEAGGVHTSPCPYTISGTVTLGPKKINCNLTIQGSAVVTFAGPVWVNGNIVVQNSAKVKVASSLGASGVALIADSTSNPTGGGTVTLQNSAVFEGSGQAGSYVLIVSQNRSAESGGSTVAIDVKNSVDGNILAYAGHGLIQIQNSVDLKEVAAWKIRALNSSEVIYETGLANANFSSGPGGSWEILPGSYVIVP